METEIKIDLVLPFQIKPKSLLWCLFAYIV